MVQTNEVTMKQACKIIVIWSVFISGFLFGQTLRGQEYENSRIEVSLDPEYSGVLQYDNVTDSVLYPETGTATIEVDVDYYAGWMSGDTETVYNDEGLPVEIIFHATEADKSSLADSLVISEVFFCAEPEDSLSDWFEICNFGTQSRKLEHAFVQTSAGKQYFDETIEIPPQSCVMLLGDHDFNLNSQKDSLILADSEGRVISRFSWDASRMNFPEDSLFSLEIKDVFISEDDVSNWEIIYGTGRGGKLPEKYADLIEPKSVWIWLKFVVWGISGVLLILLFVLSFRGKRRN